MLSIALTTRTVPAWGLPPQDEGNRRMNHIPLNRDGRQSVVVRKEVSPTNLLRDVRYGLRGLRGSLGLTVVIVTVLGIGIGANVAMFTVVDAAFLRPLRLPDPDRLVQIQEARLSEGSAIPVPYPNFIDWEKQAQSFESMGIAGVFQETLKQTGGNERIPVAYVSAGFLRAYRVQPVAGRLFTAADDRTGAPPIALVGYRFWQTHFGGDRNAIGRTLILDEQAWTIAGVAAPFQWHRPADVFVPIAVGQNKWGLNMREQRSDTGVIARLKAGVSAAQARAEMKVIAAGLAKHNPAPTEAPARRSPRCASTSAETCEGRRC
jgi:hypothetical protein